MLVVKKGRIDTLVQGYSASLIIKLQAMVEEVTRISHHISLNTGKVYQKETSGACCLTIRDKYGFKEKLAIFVDRCKYFCILKYGSTSHF